MEIALSTLVRLAGDAMIGMFRHADGFEAKLTRDSWYVASGTSEPLLNWITIVEQSGAAEAALRDAVATVRSRGLPAFIYLNTPAIAAMEPVCRSLGMTDFWPVPLLAMDLQPLPTEPLTPGLSIERVRDGAGLTASLGAIANSFEMPASAAEQAIQEPTLDEPGFRMTAAVLGGVTVGAAAISRFGSIVYLDSMATLPGLQRRGIGRALLTRVLNDEIATGATYAFLIASQEGRPLYERLGFRLVSEALMSKVEPTIAF